MIGLKSGGILLMGESKRFDWFFEKHFGIGIRWDDYLYPLHLSIAIPFLTFTVGIGQSRNDRDRAIK